MMNYVLPSNEALPQRPLPLLLCSTPGGSVVSGCASAVCVFVSGDTVFPVLGLSWNKGLGAPGPLGSCCNPDPPQGIQLPSLPVQILLSIQAVLFFRPGLPLPSCILGWADLSLVSMSGCVGPPGWPSVYSRHLLCVLLL